MFRTILVGLTLLLVNGCTDRGEEITSEATAMLSEERYEEAVPLLEQAVEMGNATAQLELGNLYKDGNGVEIDPEMSAQLYMASAAQGNSEAQYMCAESYISGRGVERSEEKAVEYIKQCAEQGNIKCKARLIMIYRSGIGGDVDNEKAIELAESLASSTIDSDTVVAKVILRARVNLSRIYLFGDGAKVDTLEAYKWLLIYNEDKKIFGARSQGNMFANIRMTDEGLTKAQKEECQRRAEEVLGRPLSNLHNMYIVEE